MIDKSSTEKNEDPSSSKADVRKKRRHINPKARSIGFTGYCGLSYAEFGDDSCTIGCELQPHHLNPSGAVHGGLIATMTDVAAGTMALEADNCEHNIVTQNCNLHFLRPAQGKMLRAVAKIIRKGRRVCVIDVDCFDDDGKLCTHAVYEVAYLDVPVPDSLILPDSVDTDE